MLGQTIYELTCPRSTGRWPRRSPSLARAAASSPIICSISAEAVVPPCSPEAAAVSRAVPAPSVAVGARPRWLGAALLGVVVTAIYVFLLAPVAIIVVLTSFNPTEANDLSADRLLAALVRRSSSSGAASSTRSASACGSASSPRSSPPRSASSPAYGLVRCSGARRGVVPVAGDAAHDGPAPPDQHLAPARADWSCRSPSSAVLVVGHVADLPALHHRRASSPASRASTPQLERPR